ncbi:MAG: 4'-phosphopantetheinyl transferase family protein [Flavobacteriales bacterium]
MEKTRGNIALVEWAIGEIDMLDSHESILNLEEINQLNSFGSAQRKREFNAGRHLKHQVFGEKLIIYGENGKPRFDNSDITIGISHSAHWALFAHARIPFGCDIEEVSDRIIPISDRFCSSDELELFAGEVGVVQLTQLWSCKEALYKLINIKGIHWKNQMRCIAISGTKFTFAVETGTENLIVNCNIVHVKNVILSIATYA